MKKITGELPYQVLLVSSDRHNGKEPFAWLDDLVTIHYVNKEKQCEQLLLSTCWDLIILDSDLITGPFQMIFKSLPEQNQWSSFLIIGASSNSTMLTEILSTYSANTLGHPFNKNSFISFALTLAKISRQKRLQSQRIILAIGAHPDDIEIGCGGYLALLREQGHNLNFLTLSLGENGGNKAARKKESTSAASLLQANLILKGLKDTSISDTSKTIRVIEEVVLALKPTHVFTHSLHDNHQDHRNTHLASMVGCRTVPNINCYQSPSSTVDFRPTLFIDITEHYQAKLAAIRCYKSQGDIKPYLERSIIYSTAKYWGRHSNYRLAEPYEILKMRGGNIN